MEQMQKSLDNTVTQPRKSAAGLSGGGGGGGGAPSQPGVNILLKNENYFDIGKKML